MAQSTRTTPTPPRPVEPPTPAPTPAPPPPPPPAARPMVGAQQAMVTDRMLMDQLRMIWQTANRHEPVPHNTHLDKKLLEALSEIAHIAQRAVREHQ